MSVVKTQHIKCPSIRELYTMMKNGQPINSHFHKLFDAPDCDLDDDSVIMSSDTDDITDIIQAQADMQTDSTKSDTSDKVDQVDQSPVEKSVVDTIPVEPLLEEAKL